jgi:hypothetical protein
MELHKNHTIPILMHQMSISITSVMLRPNNLTERLEMEPNTLKDRVMHEEER